MARIKKAQEGTKTPSPTYKNLRMGVANSRAQSKTYPRDGQGATKEDSAFYRFGFNRGLKGQKEYPGEPPVQKMGRWEGQNARKDSAKKYQAGGVVSKKVKAPMVDPKGAFTKVQQRTIAGKKTGSKKK
jgi:hypothetical protein